MALDNATLSDLSFKAVSNTFDTLSAFVQTSTQSLTFFVTSLAYWVILIVVIAVALGMVYLFFWVYYRALMSMLHVYPVIQDAVSWVDYNLIERLKRMSEGKEEAEEEVEPEPAYAGRDQGRPVEAYRRDES